MADSAEDTIPASTVRIIVDPGKNDDCPKENLDDETSNANNKKSEENSQSIPETENILNSCNEKPRDRVIRPSLFLRPSALSGEVFKSNSTVNASLPKLNVSNNKFAIPDASVDSIFDIPPKPEKIESKPVLITPLNIPAPSPLSNPDYVFGQNMLSRVTERLDSVSNGNGGGLLFTAALTAENGTGSKSDGKDAKESSSLLEDAARCQEQRAAKRKYDEVLVSTGEENEINVLQITVKLFAFEGGSWVERGRGTLRLNDSTEPTGGSRIVVRTLGSLRVVLNTKIWSGMEFARANERSVRTTALDASGQLKIFLIQGSPSDVSSLHTCMEIRLRKCREETKTQRTQEEEEEEDNEKSVADCENKEDEETSHPSKILAVEAAT